MTPLPRGIRWFPAIPLLAAMLWLTGMTIATGQTTADDQELPPRPEGFVLDEGGFLDTSRAERLSQYLTDASKNDIRVFLVTYADLPGGEVAGGRATRLMRAWFPEGGYGAVLIFLESDRRFAVVAHPDFERIRGERSVKLVSDRAEKALARNIPLAVVLREAAMDLEYEMRQSLREYRHAESRRTPLLIGGGLLTLAFAGSILFFAIHRMRLQNLFDKARTFPITRMEPRLGGVMSGGHSAVSRCGPTDKTPG